MSKIPNGVRTETIQNLEFDAGLILKTKYTGQTDIKSLVLCATTGGIKVNISAIKRKIAFDGLLENTAGIEVVDGYTGSVQFSTKEVDADMVKKALGYADVSNGIITLKQGVIPFTEGEENGYYEKEICILGKMNDDSWRQIILSRVMNVNGLQETRNDKGETEIAFDLQANYGIDAQDTPPIKIEYITATAGGGTQSTQV